MLSAANPAGTSIVSVAVGQTKPSVADAEVAGIKMAPMAPATTREPRLSLRDFFTGNSCMWVAEDVWFG